MKLNLNLVRGYVLLAGDLIRLAGWFLMVVSLITNYFQGWRRQYAKLQRALPLAKWQMGLLPN